MPTNADYNELVSQLAFKQQRNDAIYRLIGAINARDLARVTVRPEVKGSLIQGLTHENAKVRWWCLQLMDHLADESFIPYILPLLDDPVGKVRKHAIHALTCDICKPDKCGLALNEEVRRRIEAAAQMDPDHRVRQEARRGLSAWAQAQTIVQPCRPNIDLQ
ncbi:MAG: HEAT repeat domain-containing protein [Anaerolineales bacterium]|nr:HEAT repeat domain-containing protein [Anaerolineales bacterium]